MRLTPMIPKRLRVGLEALKQSWGDLRDTQLSSGRPVFRSMHTPAEIDALSRQARKERAALQDQLREAGKQTEVEARLRTLTLIEVRHPTEQSVTLIFENPAADPIRYTPGQFMTLILDIGGQTVRRAYSLMGDPANSAQVAITIKRVPGGLASNWLADNATAGMRIETLGPSGRFGTAPRADQGRRVILIAGGSGITPLYSIAQSLLKDEPASHIELYYGNRRRKDVIFRKEVDALAARHDRFSVCHVLEKGHRGFKGPKGRLAGPLLGDTLPVDAHAEYYICGPDPMMEGVISFLAGAGVPTSQVFMERFTAPAAAATESTGAVWSVQFNRSGALVQAPDDQTLLETGLQAGLAMDYSCTFGGCGACKVKVISGEVQMEEPNCLTEAERSDGDVLACVARARGPVVLDV